VPTLQCDIHSKARRHSIATEFDEFSPNCPLAIPCRCALVKGRSFFENLGQSQIMTRAKFVCISKTETYSNIWIDGKSIPGTLVSVRFQSVTSGSDENKSFFASTPSGSIELGQMKKEVADQFELNKEYYVDFTAAN